MPTKKKIDLSKMEEEVTGVTSPMSSGTATEAAIFKEATMKVLQYKVWRWSRELLWDIYALRVPNIVQFYSEPNIEQIVGAQKAAEFRRIMTQNIQLKSKPTGELIEERRKDSTSLTYLHLMLFLLTVSTIFAL
jgi:NAD-dependent SIR2 family protein deacetylase